MEQSTEQQQYYTVNEVASRIHVHPALIYREIRAGRLPALRVGGRVLRIAAADLRTYLGERKMGAE